ncbi:MAG: DUF5691 domain-containing protein [Planctomycetota bacterium]
MSSSFLQALMLGSGRSPIAPPQTIAADTQKQLRELRGDRHLLPSLALFAQQLRHRAFAVPELLEGGGLPIDERPTVPEPVRPLLARLLDKRADDRVPAAIAVRCALRQANMRVHPFDLPRLPALLDLPPQEPQERAWLRRVHRTDSSPPAEAITADNWLHQPIAERIAFVRAERTRDPAAARTMLAESLANEPAQSRASLLQALAVGLSSDDQEFVASHCGGRAKSVHDVAESLLAQLPGTEQHERRIEDIASKLTANAGKRGLIRRKTTLAWPKPRKKHADPVQECALELRGICLDALAAKMGLALDELFAAAREDTALSTGLLSAALSTGRSDAIERARADEAADVGLLLYVIQDRQEAGDPERHAAFARELVSACMRPHDWQEMPPAIAFAQIHQTLRGPLPDEIAAQLLDSECLRRCLQVVRDKPLEAPERLLLEPIATLMPAATRGAFRSAIQDLALGDRQRAELLLEVLERLSPYASS